MKAEDRRVDETPSSRIEVIEHVLVQPANASTNADVGDASTVIDMKTHYLYGWENGKCY